MMPPSGTDQSTRVISIQRQTMLIPITFNPPSSQNPKLPTALAKISHDEVVLVELQGALDVEVAQPTDKNGKFVGKLTVDESGSKR